MLTSRADAAPVPVAEAAAPVAVAVPDMDVVIVLDAVTFVVESMPPTPSATDGVVLFDADAAAAMNFSIVLPVVLMTLVSFDDHGMNVREYGTYAALMAPTIPDWQCFPCEQ